MARKRKAEPVTPEVSPAEVVEQADLFSDAAETVDRTLVELATGIKVCLAWAKRKLIRGESEWAVETEDGGQVFVYVQPPSIAAAKLIREQTRGKAAAREAKAQASSLCLKLAVPGHDPEITRYLASLAPEVLARYQFDELTLAAIEAARE